MIGAGFGYHCVVRIPRFALVRGLVWLIAPLADYEEVRAHAGGTGHLRAEGADADDSRLPKFAASNSLSELRERWRDRRSGRSAPVARRRPRAARLWE